MARKASSADIDYVMIPTVFTDEDMGMGWKSDTGMGMAMGMGLVTGLHFPTVFSDDDPRNSSFPSHDICDPRNLQFTQESIKDSFSKAHNGVKLEDTVSDIKGGRLDFSHMGHLEVHEGDDGRLWCENNRRLWVARQAGLPAVDVKIKSNDFKSRRLGEQKRENFSDPDFLPKVRTPVHDGLH